MAARQYVSRLSMAVALTVCSVVLMLGGAVLITISAFLWLETMLGTIPAAGLTGLALLLLGTISLWIVHKHVST